MPELALPLDDLTQQITEHQARLEQLRREYEARQARLAELARQKEELQARLQQVEAEMQAVKGGPSGAAAAPTPPAPLPAGEGEGRPTLTELLVEAVRAAGRPVTVKQLAQEVTRRNFPTTSRNVTNLVSTRVKQLVQRGTFRRAPGRSGVLLATPATGPTAPAAKAPPGTAAGTRKEGGARQEAARAKPNGQGGRRSLRALLADLLRKSRGPLAARELAAQALAAGYQTRSKNFTDVVWTALGQMDDVENVPGQGWRLKKG